MWEYCDRSWLLISAVASRMASSGGDGHRHARSQTMPIIRGKNALTNPKLLHMMETGDTRTLKLMKRRGDPVEMFMRDLGSVSRWEYPGRRHPESDRY